MISIIDYLFGQYSEYSGFEITLEVIAVFFGLLSVWFAKQNSILVFPTGIVSTLIFVYLLYKWELLGDMMINAYYFIMSIYGWYVWTRKTDVTQYTQISQTTKKEKWISLLIFILTVAFVYGVYQFFEKWTSFVAYIDTFTTAIFFVGMWLMAKRKIENWIFWIIGDLVSVPLYFYKGYTFTSLQYLVFTLLAIYGYLSWKKTLNKREAAAIS